MKKQFTVKSICIVLYLAFAQLNASNDSIQIIHPHTVKTSKYSTTNAGNKSLFLNEKIYPEYYICVKLNASAFDSAKANLENMRLWINKICFKNIQPNFLSSDSCLIYQLSLDTSKSSAWKMYYGYPQYLHQMTHNIEINAGTLTNEFTKLKAKPNILVSSDIKIVVIAYGLFLISLIIILKFFRGIIRNTDYYTKAGISISYNKNTATDAASSVLNISDIPYSLSRVQFLFWLLIIYISILHIWGFTDVLASPTGTVLLLLGISGTTFFVGNLIDNSSGNSNALAVNVTPTQIINDLMKINQGRVRSKFIYDILSDGENVSLHRLQLVMFTALLGVYFSWYVIFNLQMPQFSETMMLLMGISSTTYAGMKSIQK